MGQIRKTAAVAIVGYVKITFYQPNRHADSSFTMQFFSYEKSKCVLSPTQNVRDYKGIATQISLYKTSMEHKQTKTCMAYDNVF